MNCRIVEMRNREVICLKDGSRLGVVCDVEIDTCTGKLASVIIYGKPKLWGLMGKEPDIVIPWEEIQVFGEETILVSCDPIYEKRESNKKMKFLE